LLAAAGNDCGCCKDLALVSRGMRLGLSLPRPRPGLSAAVAPCPVALEAKPIAGRDEGAGTRAESGAAEAEAAVGAGADVWLAATPLLRPCDASASPPIGFASSALTATGSRSVPMGRAIDTQQPVPVARCSSFAATCSKHEQNKQLLNRLSRYICT
jgi:hypothetical protein